MFFATHYCSDLCKSLGLTQFDLAPTELKKLERISSFSKQRRGTQCRGSEEQVIGSLTNYFRHRIRNRSSASDGDATEDAALDSDDDDDKEDTDNAVLDALHEEDEDEESSKEDEEEEEEDRKEESSSSSGKTQQEQLAAAAAAMANQRPRQASRRQSRGSASRRNRRVRNDSGTNEETEAYLRHIESSKKMFRPRSSCVFVEKDLMTNRAQSVRRRGGISARGSIGNEEKDGEGLLPEFDPNEESILGRVLYTLFIII